MPALSSAAPRPNRRPSAFGGLERVAVPVRGVPGRLDVVVRVEQDRGGAGRGGAVGHHGRLAARDGQHVDVGQARGAEQGGDDQRALVHLRRSGRIRRHGRDPDQAFEVGTDGRQDLPDGFGQRLGVAAVMGPQLA